MLSKSEVLNWRTDHLGSAAKTWDDQANHVESTIASAQHAIEVLSWGGIFTEWFRKKLQDFVNQSHPKVEKLRSAALNARVGEGFLQKAKSKAVTAIQDAEKADFTVSEDLSVKDNKPGNKRETDRVAYETKIKMLAQTLETTDKQIADALHKIAEELSAFHLDGPDGGTNFTGNPDPRVLGPGGPLKHEQDDDDLAMTIPGTGIRLGGDRRDGRPTIDIPGGYSGENPLGDPDVSRALPTGAAAGPDGNNFAGFSVLPYGYKINGEEVFATKDTTIVNLDDPAHPIGTLKGVSQASFVYDPDKNRMIIVGNETNNPNDRTRMMWEVPYDKNNPNGWANETPRLIGPVSSLPGNRETQLVALQGGGYALVGADNGNPSAAIAAATPEGLRNPGLTPTAVTPPQYYPPNPQGHPPGWDTAIPYAPVVVDQHYDPATGRVTLDMRQSSWGWLPDPNNPGRTLYDPHTWTTNIVVQQPGR